MLPTHNDVHVDGLLTNLVIGYKNPDAIYDQILPIVNTFGVESGKYAIFDQDDQFRDTAAVIPPGGNYPVDGYRISSDTWSTEEIGQATELPDRTYNNATGAFKKALKLTKAQFCAKRVELKREIDTASVVFADSWGTNDTTAIDWSDKTNSNPIQDIIDAGYTIESATGMTPNVLVLGNQVWKELRNNPTMLDFLGSNERASVKISDAQDAFDLPKILVGKTIKNTANEGQTASYSNVWGADAVLLYVDGSPTPDPYSASAGYIFQSEGLKIWTWRPADRKTTFYAATVMQDMKVCASNLGYRFETIVS